MRQAQQLVQALTARVKELEAAQEADTVKAQQAMAKTTADNQTKILLAEMQTIRALLVAQTQARSARAEQDDAQQHDVAMAAEAHAHMDRSRSAQVMNRGV